MDAPDSSDSDSSLLSDNEQEAISVTDSGAKKGQHSKAAKTPTSSKERFVKEDIEVIVGWLENKANFAWVFGTAKQTSIGKHPRAPAKGWEEVANLVNKRRKGQLAVTGKATRDRFKRHKKTYIAKKEKRKSKSGFGLSPKDHDNNINTIEQKLEGLCHCYARMDQLFSADPNITPWCAFSQDLTMGYEGSTIGTETGKEDEASELPEETSEIVEEDEDPYGLEAEIQGVLRQQADETRLRDSMQELELDTDLDLNTTYNTNDSSPSDDINSALVAPRAPSRTAKRSRRLSDTTDTDSPPRPSRAKDPRKAPPRLETGPSPSAGKSSLATAIQSVGDARWKGEDLALGRRIYSCQTL